MTGWKFYREDGEVIEATPEKWQWEADYSDGFTLKQFDDYGRFHQFKEIDQSKLVSFRMVCEGAPQYIIRWKPEYKLIHFYRVTSLENFTIKVKLYCFGFETDKVKVILFIMPDNSIIVTDDIDNINIEV